MLLPRVNFHVSLSCHTHGDMTCYCIGIQQSIVSILLFIGPGDEAMVKKTEQELENVGNKDGEQSLIIMYV